MLQFGTSPQYFCPKITTKSEQIHINQLLKNFKTMKNKTTALILCLLGFVGLGGLHRFYLGHIGMGILYFCTGGLCGIGTIIDLLSLDNMVNMSNLLYKNMYGGGNNINVNVAGQAPDAPLTPMYDATGNPVSPVSDQAYQQETTQMPYPSEDSNNKTKKIILGVVGGLVLLGIIGAVANLSDDKKERNDTNASSVYESDSEESGEPVEAMETEGAPYTFKFLSKDLIEVLDGKGNPIRYKTEASNTSVGDAVEEYRQLAAYGFYAFSIAKAFDTFSTSQLDRYAKYVFDAPLGDDCRIDNPMVRQCINDAYRLERGNGKMDQNFLVDEEGLSKAYCTTNEDGDLQYVYVEKSEHGGTLLRSKIL